MMSDKPLMKCGHVANATTSNGKPCCVICAPSPQSMEIENKKISVDGRMAKCGYCTREAPSNFNLPFFEHLPDKAKDSYYCGCFGWD